MHDPDLIFTITGGLTAALLFGFITHRLGLSPIVGYLLAGVAVGPSTPGFVANAELANQTAEIGVILLMFGVGLHFHLQELLAVRRVAIPGAVGQSLASTVLGCLLAVSIGWTLAAGLVFGLAISVASTVVLIRVLADNNDLHTPTGHIAVGWLIVEDLFTVFVLVLLPLVFATEASGGGGMALALVWSLVKIGLLIVFVFLVGGRLIPWILTRVAATHSRELFTLTVLVLAMGIAVGAAKIFGVSMALGAFLAGMVVGQSDFSARAGSEALPMRDAFAVLFFVSVGMLFDPMSVLEAPGMLAGTLAIILAGKPLAAMAIVALMGYSRGVALAVAAALSQIGEFSFILASLGRDLDILTQSAVSTLIAAALVSISINPIVYRVVKAFEAQLRRSHRLRDGRHAEPRLESEEETSKDAALRYRAIVVGYGPVGRTLVRLLTENGVEPTVIELNPDTIRHLREQGIRGVYGDSADKEILRAAGVERAVALILSASDSQGSKDAIRLAREANSKIRVFARATYLHEVPALRLSGADAVFASEGEVALTMTEFILRQLGATDEQIDRERSRVWAELFGKATTFEPLFSLEESQPGGENA
ncbi:MAG: putative cation/proton antiporter YbaL [bacterium]|nr:putative cation/proton antiporter YbaL [bacterium]